jgi:glucosamine-6-phosphate deaminase
MRVIILPDAESVSRRAASTIAELVRKRPDCVLGLATGSTPLGVYRELVRLHREEGLDFSRVITFNLDEYVGLAPSHPQSYWHFMQANLFDHLNINPQNTHVPDGLAEDYEEYCPLYEKMIDDAGGIDLQLLGIGGDGHIAFNEPGSSLGSRTRLKTLAPETIRDNARFFSSPAEVPRLAVTMGVGTILDSRRCLLLAYGASKAVAIAQAVEGPLTAQVTASALQLHREATVIIDEAAAGQLTRREYYDAVEQSNRLLQEEASSRRR